MPDKNDVSAFITGKAQAPILQDREVPKKTTQEKRGRKPKSATEKESAVIALKFTESEKKILVDKAGRVPIATFLKAYLREDTDIFE